MQTNFDLKLTVVDGSATLLTAEATGSDVNTSDELMTQVFDIPTGSTDIVIPVGEVTPVTSILLEADQSLSVKINTSTIALPFKALALVGTSITALTVSNDSGNAAKLKVTLKG